MEDKLQLNPNPTDPTSLNFPGARATVGLVSFLL
jgi:hypothetical protein